MTTAKKYYTVENDRHFDLESFHCTDIGAAEALERLSKVFLPEGWSVRLTFAKRGHTSYARHEPNTRLAHIRLAPSRTWLTVAHEFAHVVDFARRGDSFHDKVHAALVDEITSAIRRTTWLAVDLERAIYGHEVAIARGGALARSAKAG